MHLYLLFIYLSMCIRPSQMLPSLQLGFLQINENNINYICFQHVQGQCIIFRLWLTCTVHLLFGPLHANFLCVHE